MQTKQRRHTPVDIKQKMKDLSNGILWMLKEQWYYGSSIMSRSDGLIPTGTCGKWKKFMEGRDTKPDAYGVETMQASDLKQSNNEIYVDQVQVMNDFGGIYRPLIVWKLSKMNSYNFV